MTKDHVMSYHEALGRTDCICIEAIIRKLRLRYVGKVIQMENYRTPKIMLFGELGVGKRNVGGQSLTYRKCLKDDLKKFNLLDASGDESWMELAKCPKIWEDRVEEYGNNFFYVNWLADKQKKQEIRHKKRDVANVLESLLSTMEKIFLQLSADVFLDNFEEVWENVNALPSLSSGMDGYGSEYLDAFMAFDFTDPSIETNEIVHFLELSQYADDEFLIECHNTIGVLNSRSYLR
jgi:hypothetical protein